jgi:hypothetical protein
LDIVASSRPPGLVENPTLQLGRIFEPPCLGQCHGQGLGMYSRPFGIEDLGRHRKTPLTIAEPCFGTRGK